MPENSPKDNINEIRTALGQYSLQKKIAQGGMAEIYKGIASDIHGIKRTVVIKKILPHIAANKEFVDMLVSEAKIAVQLSHGNIAQIYDLGRVGNDYFMVMEFVDGKSLSQIHKRCLKEGHLIPLDQVCYFISEVAAGLDYMHNKTDSAGEPLGIVHRDISPQNVIISYSGTVKIIDFGIAKAAAKIDKTEVGVLKGKFAYMSPEQARGEMIDHRSDIFSLGIILHELTSGRRLFKDKDNKATVRNVRRAEVEPPSKFNALLPKEIDEIVMKALAKEPVKRYQRAGEMKNDLVKFLSNAYPGFKTSSAEKLIVNLFGEHDSSAEAEDEVTPLLIIDQTQPALQLGAPSVLKEFMLNEDEQPKAEAVKDAAAGKAEDEKKEKKARLAFLRSEKLLKYAKKAAHASVAAIGFTIILLGGHKLGIWKMWSDFFDSVTIKEGEKEAAMAAKFTKVIIDSEPAGAKIYLDDMATKLQTPATIDDIKADGKPHRIGLYIVNHKYLELPFTAIPDETLRFSARIEMAFGELKATSDPESASVYINGEYKGATPFTMENLEPGKILSISINKDGYLPLEQTVRIAPNKTIILRASLMREPKKRGSSIAPSEPPINKTGSGAEKLPSTEEKSAPASLIPGAPYKEPSMPSSLDEFQDSEKSASESTTKVPERSPKEPYVPQLTDEFTEAQKPAAGRIEVIEKEMADMPKLLPPAPIDEKRDRDETDKIIEPAPENATKSTSETTKGPADPARPAPDKRDHKLDLNYNE